MFHQLSRRMLYKGMLMEITGSNILPLLLGSVGIIVLYKLLQRMKQRAYIQDTVVVITGASSGLGKECAKLFHSVGARLVLCGRDRQKLEELVQELTGGADGKRKTHTPNVVTFDLRDVDAMADRAEEIVGCFGQVDILINNAGISHRGTILDTDVSVDRDVMNINYFGPIALTKDGASKHATQAFFDCLRAEVEQFGILVTVISPGYIRTNLSVNAVTGDGSKYGVMDKNTAEGWDPQDVAKAILTAVSRKKKDVVLAGMMPTLAVYLRTLLPCAFFPIMAARARKERKVKKN
ncbi:dehydrogenase/reductase SDR family member 7B isoform X4 [Callorhinchus milii]|uniref:Dehydrogenase/reductase SDR family member 7B n=1 Tax=Callorhinchus milii TaxID=7868 RepID=A0A4W3J747_CALMI|nr:dehydrogenase/reductase SDR family member 7B isoform X4 [Callorhinchus milii]|eukprot:gi/632970501/ref/XP_007901686.1/ PREDICTED: dehydrogenase/reductase SDR family member 7B isoform X4 [Callorhinchus milii]